jgi:hypothetical protein
VAVGIDGSAVGRDVADILGDGSGPDLVELGDPCVKLGASRVPRRPEGLSVLGGSPASVRLFLTLVYNRDAYRN